jgi:hypothetical protein
VRCWVAFVPNALSAGGSLDLYYLSQRFRPGFYSLALPPSHRALNTLEDPRRVEENAQGTLLLSTHLDKEERPVRTPFLLRGAEGVIIKLMRAEMR